MENITSESSNEFIWGEPEGKLRTKGYLGLIFFAFGFIVFGVVILSNSSAANDTNETLGWALRFAMVFVLYKLWGLLSSSHFVLDGVKANHVGLSVAYSYIPKPGGNYANEKTLIGWDEIHSIDACEHPVNEDGTGYFTVGVRNRLDAPSTLSGFEFGNMTSEEAQRICEILRSFLPTK